MKGKILRIPFILLLLFTLFPLSVLAVDFSIENVDIEAQLLENGDVQVKEQHIYSFDGEFSGIIRELAPRKDIKSNIANLKAYENNKELTIESEDHIHRIHRAGEDEDIQIEITYTIVNGVQVYEDVGEFYWPFFDKRNESSYENMTITVIPPAPVDLDEVLAFGRDTAYETESTLPDGVIQFELGKVPSGENGDIRAVYPAKIFPAASPIISEEKLGSIIADEDAYTQELILWKEKQADYKSLGQTLVPTALAILIFVFVKDSLRRRRKISAITREMDGIFSVPKEILSFPATIYYTNYGQLSPEGMAASLLDLVRKKNIKQIDEDSFQVIHTNGLKEHETFFIQWLFNDIGEDGKFSFNDLNNYSKNKKNSTAYSAAFQKWVLGIHKEVKENEFYEKHPLYRILLILLGIGLIPFIVFFIQYDLPLYFSGAIILSITFVIYGLFYRPKTWEASQISYEWKQFKDNYKNLLDSEWKKWSEDDQMRAFLYALATGDKQMKKTNETLIKPFQGEPLSFNTTVASVDPTLSLFTIAMISNNASTSFNKANDSIGTSVSSDGGSSSSFGGGGGGVGGGGGGSGAF